MSQFDDFISSHLNDYLEEMAISLYRISPEFHPSLASAKLTVEKFRPVMEKIGWKWLPEEYAKRLYDILLKEITPKEWMENVKKFI